MGSWSVMAKGKGPLLYGGTQRLHLIHWRRVWKTRRTEWWLKLFVWLFLKLQHKLSSKHGEHYFLLFAQNSNIFNIKMMFGSILFFGGKPWQRPANLYGTSFTLRECHKWIQYGFSMCWKLELFYKWTFGKRRLAHSFCHSCSNLSRRYITQYPYIDGWRCGIDIMNGKTFPNDGWLYHKALHKM